MPLLRLFIAVQTPPQIRSQISPIIRQLKESNAEVRWEPEEKLHATIKFLGGTDEAILERISSELERVCADHGGLSLSYRGLGCFPNRQRPRVIWIGMEDMKGNLSSLHEKIESSMALLGFEREERSFRLHITLGRVKGARRLPHLLSTLETITFESQPVTINEIVIVKSELRQSGSVYTTLKTIPLGSETG